MGEKKKAAAVKEIKKVVGNATELLKQLEKIKDRSSTEARKIRAALRKLGKPVGAGKKKEVKEVAKAKVKGPAKKASKVAMEEEA